MTTIGSDIIAACEGIYARAAELHPDLPRDVVFVTGTGRGNKRSYLKLGHWAEGRWQAREDTDLSDRCHELLISGECLAGGAMQVLTTILHESAHALATARSVKDTSRGSRYHNRKFVALAEELGMHYPHDSPHGTIGWSDVALNDDTANDYDLDALDRAIKAAIGSPLMQAAAPPKKQRQVILCTFEDGTEVEIGLKKYEELADKLDTHDAVLVVK